MIQTAVMPAFEPAYMYLLLGFSGYLATADLHLAQKLPAGFRPVSCEMRL